MQALLSYDQSPPIAAPFRFFLTAPVFGVLGGMLLTWQGPELLASRWTPGTLALTHLITVGFMLQVMLGALVQILPVVAGANLARPLLVSAVVHLAMSFGALFLAVAFLRFDPYWFGAASIFLGAGTIVFITAAAHALLGVPSASPTISGLKLSFAGLGVTVALGVLMSLAIGGSIELPLLQVADIHLGWGFVGWGLVLLAAVAYVVVPMFQLTPDYPRRFGRGFLVFALIVVTLWSVVEWFWPGPAAELAGIPVLAAPVAFAFATLRLQTKSKRPRFDATQHLWRGAMFSALVAASVWGAAMTIPEVGEWPGWPLMMGVLVLFGGFVSVITGMLYKIVPFLIWLHLQNLGSGKMMAPNMKKIIEERAMTRQMWLHFLACLLLVLAVLWPQWLAYPAGVALIVAQATLGWNLRAAMRVYALHRQNLADASGRMPARS